MTKKTKLMISLGIEIALLIAFISSCITSSNVEIKCRQLAQIREPSDMGKQQLAYEAEKWSYYYMKKQPDSRLKEMIEEFYIGRKLSYLTRAIEYDMQKEAFNKMNDISNSELKTLIVTEYPDNYNEQLINYNKQLKSKEYVEGLEKVFQMVVRDKYPNDYCKQEEYFLSEYLDTSNNMEKEGYFDD